MFLNKTTLNKLYFVLIIFRDNMTTNAKIYFELVNDEVGSVVKMPENLTSEQQLIFADRMASLIIMIQNGQLLPSILQSIVESGILTDQKFLSELIIKKILENFSIDTEKTPLVSPSEAFLFRDLK